MRGLGGSTPSPPPNCTNGLKGDEPLREEKASGETERGSEGASAPHRSFGEAVVDKVLPGDLAAAVAEQVGDGATERDRAKEDQSELLVVPRHIALATTGSFVVNANAVNRRVINACV